MKSLAAGVALRVSLLALLWPAGAVQATCPTPDPASATATATAAGSAPALAPAQSLSSGPVQARWTTEPARLQVGEPFVLTVWLCPARAQLAGVDATMPDHRHGMNYRPGISQAGQGQWRVEALLWHMSGRWELTLDTLLDGVPRRLTQSVTLP